VRVLLKDLEPDTGTVRHGSRLAVGYYRQGHEHLDPTLEVWRYLQSVIVSADGSAQASEQLARNLAGAFMFSDREQDKQLGSLSGGERSRAVLAGLVSSAKNFLVLDEPSNHLDIPSAEQLEYSLSPENGYDGTLLLITHDRALLQATCNKLLIFRGDGEVKYFHGTYLEWEQQSKQRSERDSAAREQSQREEAARQRKTAEAKSTVKSTAAAATMKAPAGPFAKVSLSELEKRIEKIELQLSAIDEQLLDPAVLRDGERARSLQQDRQELAGSMTPLEEEWSRRAE
jgi:ATP-binding cassette subfamily F protein 3